MKVFNKKNLPKIGMWLASTYIWGYLGGALVISVPVALSILLGESYEFPSPSDTYYIGLRISFNFLIVMAPVFLISLWMWLKIAKNHPKLETSWGGVIKFTLLMGSISGLFLGLGLWDFRTIYHHPLKVFYALKNFNLSSFLLYFLVGFFGGWLGTLMPRILIKKLRPGRFL